MVTALKFFLGSDEDEVKKNIKISDKTNIKVLNCFKPLYHLFLCHSKHDLDHIHNQESGSKTLLFS